MEKPYGPNCATLGAVTPIAAIGEERTFPMAKAPNKTTHPKAATAASKTMTSKTESKAAKSAAASALSQTPPKKKK